jgi:hypothetical protein
VVHEPGRPGSASTLVIVSIDTEEDNWDRSRSEVTLENIRELPTLVAFFKRWGVRPTYFTTYQVATDSRAASVLREAFVVGGGEIATHLHPWNTPPLTEAFVPRNSMLANLPADLQLAKLRRVTGALQEAFQVTPRAFRAGRYGLGTDTVPALLSCGYRVDSSVMPFFSWKEVDDGPGFLDAPLAAYRLAPGHDVTDPAREGDLIEIPLSCGFSRRPFNLWARVRAVLDAPALRPLHLVGLVARTGLCKRVVLSPELSSVADMLRLSRRLLDQGVRHLQLTWHSPTLKPGLSPFAATAADVARLYASVAAYLEGLARITPLTFATVSEAGAALAEDMRAPSPVKPLVPS